MATITVDRANVTIENGKIIIDIDATQLENILHNDMIQLSSLKPGEKFMLGDEKFKVLEQTNNGTRVISDKFAYSNTVFGNNNNWAESSLREKLNNEYFIKIAKIVGENNIIPMTRDLTSLDGLDDYGTCVDKISLLTASEYAKYHKILGLKSKHPSWWWLITPISTSSNGYSRDVCCVLSCGILYWNVCYSCSGVRPFFDLNSSIFVSKVEGI